MISFTIKKNNAFEFPVQLKVYTNKIHQVDNLGSLQLRGYIMYWRSQYIDDNAVLSIAKVTSGDLLLNTLAIAAAASIPSTSRQLGGDVRDEDTY